MWHVWVGLAHVTHVHTLRFIALKNICSEGYIHFPGTDAEACAPSLVEADPAPDSWCFGTASNGAMGIVEIILDVRSVDASKEEEDNDVDAWDSLALVSESGIPVAGLNASLSARGTGQVAEEVAPANVLGQARFQHLKEIEDMGLA